MHGELVLSQTRQRGEGLVALITLLLLLVRPRMGHQPVLLQLARPRGLVVAEVAGEVHAHVGPQLVPTQHAHRYRPEITLVAHKSLLLVADFAMAFEAVGAGGEEVALVAAVGDALVDGELVLAQVAGIARLMAAGVAQVLDSFLKKEEKTPSISQIKSGELRIGKRFQHCLEIKKLHSTKNIWHIINSFRNRPDLGPSYFLASHQLQYVNL